MPRIGSKDFSVEFNDAVFETKAWQNSRYNGKELSGAQINKHTAGDVSFGKTPVIRNVSRNIYVGNTIIELGDVNTSDDGTLIQFPSSSYVTIEKYLTVNDDDTISENNFDGSDLDSKNGFYRSFYEDFPIGGDFQLTILDESINNFTLDNYKVIFNQGKLHTIATLKNNGFSQTLGINTGAHNIFQLGSPIFSDGDAYNKFKVFNNTFTNSFYTGSYTSVNTYGEVFAFFNQMFDSMQGIENINNRYFLSFCGSGSVPPLGSPATNLSPPPFKDLTLIGPPNKLADFATAEIGKYPNVENLLKTSDKFRFSKRINSYSNGQLSNNDAHSYTLGKLSDSTPSILTNLSKPEQLPDGTGDLPFIVIPSNIHPYIKDNLLYFLGQAGVDIGNRRIPNQLDGQNRKLT